MKEQIKTMVLAATREAGLIETFTVMLGDKITWTVSKINERLLSLFERKVLRCIFGAKQENGTWRKRYNYELF